MLHIKYPHFLILLLCLICVLACNSSLNFLQEAQNFEDVMTYTGTGEHTWTWNHGEQFCKTQNEMTLIVSDRSSDEIISFGKCMAIKGLHPYTCYVWHPDENCQVIFKGDYNGDTFTPRSCSGDYPVSGEVINKKSVLTGTLKCGDDTFVISIPLTKKK